MDDNVVSFSDRRQHRDVGELVEAARDTHLDAFRLWLEQAKPDRYEAEIEAEIFCATVRQMLQLYTRAPRA